jgi:hypothetical protein
VLHHLEAKARKHLRTRLVARIDVRQVPPLTVLIHQRPGGHRAVTLAAMLFENENANLILVRQVASAVVVPDDVPGFVRL